MPESQGTFNQIFNLNVRLAPARFFADNRADEKEFFTPLFEHFG
jgi:hypothetical protein